MQAAFTASYRSRSTTTFPACPIYPYFSFPNGRCLLQPVNCTTYRIERSTR